MLVWPIWSDVSFIEKDAHSAKAEGKVLLSKQEARLPSPAPSKFGAAEPAKGRLFIGM